ncbi:hypothetical protein AGMMS50225_20400 [Betaproteobacteria bacterium]|nr:hypothetical protein AGMMS50225_20400 [Betaproteobacteria bacterium]
MFTKPKLLLCLAFATVLAGCDVDDGSKPDNSSKENTPPAAENQTQESKQNNVYVAKYASKFEHGPDTPTAWAELIAEEWQKIAPSLQSALECRTSLPNTPEIRTLLKGETSKDRDNFSIPVSEQYFEIMSLKNTNVPQNTFGDDLNFVGEIIPSDDFRVFGLPVKKINITRLIGGGDFGGYYVWSTIQSPQAQLNKAAGLKNSDDTIKTKVGMLNSFAAEDDNLILQCFYWQIVFDN